MGAKQKVTVTTTKTKSRVKKKNTKPKGGRKRCPHCGRYY